ncbi:hypothetical protein LZ318_15480 [Saccharopolyspora indica]|uniref:DUF7716 domain-containing protein n=1 Tax=Saccharopolyspora indica TaxID=1229659 RepID=UPI0022EACF72|nr:hypothetical protein [Saccharopolyspora indica]MDA3649080.1 hypothetical protein [Saccharopolyspora indica]
MLQKDRAHSLRDIIAELEAHPEHDDFCLYGDSLTADGHYHLADYPQVEDDEEIHPESAQHLDFLYSGEQFADVVRSVSRQKPSASTEDYVRALDHYAKHDTFLDLTPSAVEQILEGPPSKLAFRALCAALDHADSPPDLASWPDAVREAPWSWLAALDSGRSKPTWPLVRSLVLEPTRSGVRKLPLPDPRTQPEVRGVTHLDLGSYAGDQLAALAETAASWANLRSVRVDGLTDEDAGSLAELAGTRLVAQLESLDLISLHDDVRNFEKPPLRPVAGPPWRLRHAGLRASDLAHLMRSGLVPDLRSAAVLVLSAEEADDLARCAELAQLERLAIGFRCGMDGRAPFEPHFGNVIEQDDEACAAFFAHADLANLRSLAVRGTQLPRGREGLGARGVDAIGVLRQLTELTLELLPIGDDTIAAVLEEVDPERIEKLVLTDLVATDRTACAFGSFPRLRHLDLSRNRLGPAGARQLAAARLPALEHLDLSGRKGDSPYYEHPEVQPIGDLGAEALAASPNAAKLKHLNLAATGLGVDGLVTLMQLPELRSLDLARNPMGTWPATLENAPIWRTLRTLDVSECGLDDDAVEALTATSSAPVLRGISLAYNSIGSRGARALAAWPVLPQLWELNLHDNVIGDDGLTDLATSAAAQHLLELDLEQDCRNARARKYGAPLPPDIADPASFPGLDAIFLGIVDEYHGARYSSGFPPSAREELAATSTTRPELVAFLTHLDMDELDDPEHETDRTGYDFRTDRAAKHAAFTTEARAFARTIGKR